MSSESRTISIPLCFIAKEVDTKTDEEAKTNGFNIGDGFAIKDGDIELNITDEVKLRQLAQQGLNYAGKTTELAKYRSFVKYAEDNNISLEDIQQMKDIKAGNKDAYSALAKTSGIDVYDVSEDNSYAPEQVSLPQQSDPMVDSIAQEILSNEDHTSQFQKWLPHMPADVQRMVTTNSGALRAVQADINSGVFSDAMQQAYTSVKVDGMEFNAAYLQAKENIVALRAPQESKPQVTRGDKVRASSTRGSASASKGSYGAGTISDMTDDSFLENFQDIIAGLERPN